jgi:hypothetical protein
MASTSLGTFLDKSELDKISPEYGFFQLVQTETYNEYELLKSVEQIGKDICGAIAIQLAIVGYGNKNYGSIIINGESIDIFAFFKKNKIKTDAEFGSKLTPKDVTPRRLIRLFRYAISDYINDNKNIQSYLFKKYCLNKNQITRSFIYPGFEHIASPVTDYDKIKDLLQTYEYLDSRLNTKVKDRIVRVLVARGFNEDSLIGLR